MALNALYWIMLLIFLCLASTASIADTWVIIVNSSRYWFNYRHAANAAIIYNIVTQLSIPDDHIIFMNALDIANENRNPDRGTVHYRGYVEEAWSYDDIDVDYSEEEVSSDSLLELLSGRPSEWNMMKAKLNSNENSSILLYMAGHGGDEFFKFHDSQELTAQDLALTLKEMHIRGRYKDMLLIIDTCQASTMAKYITAPNIITLASSGKGENSYGYRTEQSLGVAIADRFTHSMGEFFRKNIQSSRDGKLLSRALSLFDLNAYLNPQILHSTPTILASSESMSDLRSIKLHRYFGAGNSFKSSTSTSKATAGLVAERITLPAITRSSGDGGGNGGDRVVVMSEQERRQAVEELFADALHFDCTFR